MVGDGYPPRLAGLASSTLKMLELFNEAHCVPSTMSRVDHCLGWIGGITGIAAP